MKNSKFLVLTISCFLFTYLFYKESFGLNLLIFDIFIISVFILFKRKACFKRPVGFLLAGTLLSGIFTTIHHSDWAVFTNILSLFWLFAFFKEANIRSFFHAFGISFINIGVSINDFISSTLMLVRKKPRLSKFLKFAGILLIPVLIIAIFILIYNASNPVFSSYLGIIIKNIGKFFKWIFTDIDFTIVFFFLFAVIVSINFFFGIAEKYIFEQDQISKTNIFRKRVKPVKKFKPKALINEFRAGIFLLGILNIILLFVNYIDINWVWFNFEWNGQYLKQFVHEGTFLLILSILISIGISLWFFRKNLNFYKKNKLLKWLSYIWLAQNVILALSVCIRNFWYIKYYALAYKRIGVLFFLLLTVYGIITVIIKIRKQKSTFFLIKENMFALYLVFVFISFFNWDVIIARYNFDNYKTSFVHFDFLAELSDKTLPYLDKTDNELAAIDTIQTDMFHFDKIYLTSPKYKRIIENRKEKFLKEWENKRYLSWNYAEWKAYQMIKNKSK